MPENTERSLPKQAGWTSIGTFETKKAVAAAFALNGLDKVGVRRATKSIPAVGTGELIERALPYALKATTRYELDEWGVRCMIDMPLQRRPARRQVP